jgi:four helix bundle protein
MPTYHSVEQLDCYQKCREVRLWIYRLLKDHAIADLDLRQNLKRAGRSTTRNIAEGFGRHHHKENIQFCRIAIGSLFEILDDLNILVDEEICSDSDVMTGRELTFDALKSTRGYVHYLKRL